MLFDSHTHVSDPQFETDRESVLARAKEAGLIGLTTVGWNIVSSRSALDLASKYPGFVYATVGLHPEEVEKENFDTDVYRKLAADPSVVAVGECGLDYYRITNRELEIKEKQAELFIQHIELAKEIGKPLMIHCRSASSDLIRILVSGRLSHVSSPGIIHFYTDSLGDAKKLLDLGFYFSLGGVLTFAHDYDELAKLIPNNRLLLETDAPFVAPVPHRGKRNEPSFVAETAKKLAELRGVDTKYIGELSVANAKNIFGLAN